MSGFTQWLRAQAHRDDLVGDLACDTQADPGWPSSGKRLETFERYLDRHGVDLDALRAAWREWQTSERPPPEGRPSIDDIEDRRQEVNDA